MTSFGCRVKYIENRLRCSKLIKPIKHTIMLKTNGVALLTPIRGKRCNSLTALIFHAVLSLTRILHGSHAAESPHRRLKEYIW